VAGFLSKTFNEKVVVKTGGEIKADGPWLLNRDGSSNIDVPEGNELTYAMQFDFKSSNNEAEYEAFVAGGVF
jgi:hypothetical protein